MKRKLIVGVFALLWAEAFPLPRVEKVDQVLWFENKLVFFQFMPWRYVALDSVALNKWKQGMELQWSPIVKPHQRFLPIRVKKGQSNNFLVLEKNEKKIWQLDSRFQTLTSIPLPIELQEVELNEYQFFMTPENRLVFLNSHEGLMIQYMERMGRMNLYRKDDLPLNFGLCYEAAIGEGKGLSAYPITCAGVKELLVFDPLFQKKKVIPLKLRSQGAVANKERGIGGVKSPYLYIEKGQSPVLVYETSNSKFCFTPLLGVFSSCSE